MTPEATAIYFLPHQISLMQCVLWAMKDSLKWELSERSHLPPVKAACEFTIEQISELEELLASATA